MTCLLSCQIYTFSPSDKYAGTLCVCPTRRLVRLLASIHEKFPYKRWKPLRKKIPYFVQGFWLFSVSCAADRFLLSHPDRLAWLESVKWYSMSFFIFLVDDRTSTLPTMDVNPFHEKYPPRPKHTPFTLFRFFFLKFSFLYFPEIQSSFENSIRRTRNGYSSNPLIILSSGSCTNHRQKSRVERCAPM